jgi:hypothetical protein
MAGTVVIDVGGVAGVLGPDAMAEWKLSRKDGGSAAAALGVLAGAGLGVEAAGAAALVAGGVRFSRN